MLISNQQGRSPSMASDLVTDTWATKFKLCPLFALTVLYSTADLQLDVKGCQDVYASFDKYVEVERLEGDNKYHAEQHGLQVRLLELVADQVHLSILPMDFSLPPLNLVCVWSRIPMLMCTHVRILKEYLQWHG
jgi:hypothetical protein